LCRFPTPPRAEKAAVVRYLSVCSGIEAASVAWHPLGFQAVAYAEVDAFPSAVLAHHYPDTPNHGDLTRFQEWPDADVDVLVGGTPCQSFSVAGLRAGLADPRGNLALTYLAVADRYRPRWVVWENVPGVLSSGGGRDFGAFLGGLAELGYGFAYRVLDAQYFGLAQRRKRVFVVGHLGDWRRAAAVLFERASLSGHPAPRREAGTLAPTIPARRTGGGGLGTDFDCDGGLLYVNDVSRALTSSHTATGRLDPNEMEFVAQAFDARQSDVLQYGDRVGIGMAVRRLTPRECERLQGFPDDYTLIQYRGKPAADGPRYKALGNSMAVPCMAWIGRRLQMVDAVDTRSQGAA
jgi:DNA (cytosine-5)-methyltransferase 1